MDELDQQIRKESSGNFTYHRLVPNFYPALLEEDSDRLIHVFQTVRFWRLAETLAPPALFGRHEGTLVDKLCLRIACDHILDGPAKRLAWEKKNAIQRSSGLMESLAQSARAYAAELPGAQTYTDPNHETYDAVATRLYLHLLDNGAE